METICKNCGGRMEAGVATAHGLIGGWSKEEPRLQFAIPGMPISSNPITAFKQGLAEERSTQVFWIEGHRCSQCGFLQLFAKKQAPP